jgi:hypothetical protein
MSRMEAMIYYSSMPSLWSVQHLRPFGGTGGGYRGRGGRGGGGGGWAKLYAFSQHNPA